MDASDVGVVQGSRGRGRPAPGERSRRTCTRQLQHQVRMADKHLPQKP